MRKKVVTKLYKSGCSNIISPNNKCSSFWKVGCMSVFGYYHPFS